MKDKWLKDIHDRMADFEIEEPQGLWEDICNVEETEERTPIVVHLKETRRKWMWSAAAVACLLIGWSLYPTMKQEDGRGATLSLEKTDKTIALVNPSPSDVKVASVRTEASYNIPASIEHSAKNQTESDANVPSVSMATDSLEIPANALSSDSFMAQENEDSTQTDALPSKTHISPQNTHQYLAQINKKENTNHLLARDQQERGLFIGISSSGGMGNSTRQLFHGDYVGACTTNADAEWQDSPLLGIMYLNRSAETERKVSHHAPLRTGLSVAYKLNDRWSVESGVTYAMVASDIREGSISNYVEDKQKLHYVGVPIGISYKAVTWKDLDVYVSSDFLSELCISGKTTRNYIIGDKAQQEDVIPVTSHPLQTSLGANVGVQYNLNSLLSIYAEPGCRYYFDDHSSIDNVFKERKLDFNLNMGVRFTIGK